MPPRATRKAAFEVSAISFGSISMPAMRTRKKMPRVPR
jgi:hypothetical protein